MGRYNNLVCHKMNYFLFAPFTIDASSLGALSSCFGRTRVDAWVGFPLGAFSSSYERTSGSLGGLFSWRTSIILGGQLKSLDGLCAKR